MDSQAAFTALLITANFGALPRAAVLEFCCESINELSTLPSKELDTAISNLHKSMANLVQARRVRLNASKCIMLHAIRLHFLDRNRCVAPLDAPELTRLNFAALQQMRTEYIESVNSTVNTTGLDPVAIPKLLPLKWCDFKSGVSECLSRAIGRNKIPLIYVIRPNDEGIFDRPYESREARLITCMSHTGPSYLADRGDVYSLLLQRTEGSEGHSMVENNSRSRDGRRSWLALLAHFEGSTYKERVGQEAASELRSASYVGPKRNFTFGSYYGIHSKAHTKLDRADKPMTVVQKIDTFVQGIKCAVTQTIIVNLSTDPRNRQSFESYYNAIASRLELAISMNDKVSQNETRNVNETKGKKRSTNKKTDNKTNNRPAKGPNTFVAENKIYEKRCGYP